MAGRTLQPFRVLVTAATDTPIAQIAQEIEDDRVIVTSCATENEALRSLSAGLPDVGILDGSLSGASLLRVYSALRPERSTDLIPVLFTSHSISAAAAAHGVPDVYLAADADRDAIRNALYHSLGLPLPEPTTAGPDPLVSTLLTGLRDGGFDAATYGSASSVIRELKDGLPAAAVLDARLPEAELTAVYRSLREQPGGGDLPVLFIHDPKCPPGAIVRDGSDIYLGEGASVSEALEALQGGIAPAGIAGAAASLGPGQGSTTGGAKKRSRFSFGRMNPVTARVLRALPIAAMIVIGGFAGVMTVKTFDTRSWPLAHPIEVSAATPPAFSVTSGPTETPLQALATRAAQSSPSVLGNRATPEASTCALMPAFDSLREQIGPDIIGACVDQPTIRENGDAQQPTTKGLFALRRNENWVTFTDGHKTWVRGPNGVQQRLNSERFSWESVSSTFDSPTVAVAYAGPSLLD